MVAPTLETLVVNSFRAAREERWQGRDYLVADMVTMVPGVLEGSLGPLLYPHDEVAQRPGEWNGIPLTLYHPTVNGNFVSVHHPDVLRDNIVLGMVRNDRYDRSKGKRRAEGWFDVEWTKARAPDVYKQLKAGRPIELSTGLGTKNIPVANAEYFNGRRYTHIARDYKPDHLAVLPDKSGACSVKDGCGINVVNERSTAKGTPMITLASLVANTFAAPEEDGTLCVNCRAPLHPGPCKGWKGVAGGTQGKVSPVKVKPTPTKQTVAMAKTAAVQKVVKKATTKAANKTPAKATIRASVAKTGHPEIDKAVGGAKEAVRKRAREELKKAGFKVTSNELVSNEAPCECDVVTNCGADGMCAGCKAKKEKMGAMTLNAMKCPSCGKTMPEGATKCPECGWEKPAYKPGKDVAVWEGEGAYNEGQGSLGTGAPVGPTSSTSTEPTSTSAAATAPPVITAATLKAAKKLARTIKTADDAGDVAGASKARRRMKNVLKKVSEAKDPVVANESFRKVFDKIVAACDLDRTDRDEQVNNARHDVRGERGRWDTSERAAAYHKGRERQGISDLVTRIFGGDPGPIPAHQRRAGKRARPTDPKKDEQAARDHHPSKLGFGIAQENEGAGAPGDAAATSTATGAT